MKTIKIIASDVIYAVIKDYLATGYECVQGDAGDVHAIIIDEDHHTQIRPQHNQHPKAPIIMLVGKNTTHLDVPSFVKVLEKPVRLHRLQDLLESLALVVIMVGPFRIYPKTRQMVYGKTDEKIPLTEKEIEIILFLRHRAGEVISREDLLAGIWRYNNDITTHTLETHIYRLRKKLETYGIKDFLVTKGSGYSLDLVP